MPTRRRNPGKKAVNSICASGHLKGAKIPRDKKYWRFGESLLRPVIGVGIWYLKESKSKCTEYVGGGMNKVGGTKLCRYLRGAILRHPLYSPAIPSLAAPSSARAASGLWRPDCGLWRSRTSSSEVDGAWTRYACALYAAVRWIREDPEFLVLLFRKEHPDNPHSSLEAGISHLSPTGSHNIVHSMSVLKKWYVTVFWVTKTCNLVGGCKYFDWRYCLHHQGHHI